MDLPLSQPQRAHNVSRRIGMTRLDHVMYFFSRTLASARRFKFNRKHLLAAFFALLVVTLVGVASYFWWFRSVPITYKWGSYASCPSTYIDSSDPTFVSNPKLHMKGGRKTAPFTQIEHLVACGVPIVNDAKERMQFIKSGRLELLQGAHLNVTSQVGEPYVNPLMLIFATRLSDQYFVKKCGFLDVTSALRNLERQRREIGNGSKHSAHPYGMAIDLRIPVDKRCLIWLSDTLLDIERSGRIDFGQEGNPAHFHVSLIPGAYEAGLMKELGIIPEVGYDIEEVRWLTTALYFEGDVNEPKEGLQAIASVIKNRRDGTRFSADTIEEVVKQGAKGQKNGGCHFSFMCDGLPEQPWVICQQHPKDTASEWKSSYPCGRRWAAYHRYAVEFMTAPDNTGGADHYFTGKEPRWGPVEMQRRVLIGSHWFGSRK